MRREDTDGVDKGFFLSLVWTCTCTKTDYLKFSQTGVIVFRTTHIHGYYLPACAFSAVEIIFIN